MASKFNFKQISERGMQAAGLVAGVAASKFVAKTLANKVNPKTSALIRLGIGVFLPAIAGGGSGKKATIINDVANGILAESATGLAGAFGVPGLSGIGSDGMDHISYAAQEDLMNAPAISGMDN